MNKDKPPEGKKYTDIDPAVFEKEKEERKKETSSKFMEPPLGYKSEGPGS